MKVSKKSIVKNMILLVKLDIVVIKYMLTLTIIIAQIPVKRSILLTVPILRYIVVLLHQCNNHVQIIISMYTIHTG